MQKYNNFFIQQAQSLIFCNFFHKKAFCRICNADTRSAHIVCYYNWDKKNIRATALPNPPEKKLDVAKHYFK